MCPHTWWGGCAQGRSCWAGLPCSADWFTVGCSSGGGVGTGRPVWLTLSPPAQWGLQAVELEGAAHTSVSMFSQHVPRGRASRAAAWPGTGSEAWEAPVEEVNWAPAHLAGFRRTVSGTCPQLALPGHRRTRFNMHSGPEQRAQSREVISLSLGYIWLVRKHPGCA